MAENGYQAVEAVRRGDYDAILMDIQMPGLDGIQATQQIRALPPPKGNIPIIALTAHAMHGAREEYLAAGMNDYVSKPINSALLLAALAAVGGGRDGASDREEAAAATDMEQMLTAAGIDGGSLTQLRTVMTETDVREFIDMYLSDAAPADRADDGRSPRSDRAQS